MPELDPNNKDEILKVFQEMTKQRDQLQEKLSEFLFQYSEYKRVADTLEPMDKGRKAWHLVNSVLVERNVGEVLPVVAANRDGIQKMQTGLQERLTKLQAEIKEFSTKYNGAWGYGVDGAKVVVELECLTRASLQGQTIAWPLSSYLRHAVFTLQPPFCVWHAFLLPAPCPLYSLTTPTHSYTAHYPIPTSGCFKTRGGRGNEGEGHKRATTKDRRRGGGWGGWREIALWSSKV